MDYVSLLRENDLKVTPQRLVLLEEISKCGHIDIDTLYSVVKKQFSNISLATLYKNINSMVECEILKELKLNGHKNKYEIKMDDHSHIVCKECGSVEDINIEKNQLLSSLNINSPIYSSELSITVTCCKNCA
jgi:Fur family peroxide stress response transcriptional regulator